MTCLVCKKSSDSIDCFNDALEILKQHFIFYKNSLSHREEELQNVKERNERLNKALELLQTSQQPSKKFKTQEWVPPPPVDKNSTACLTDISLTDDDEAAAGGFSNLNMALNSEQLFETSIISPAKPEAALITSASEMVVSPRAKLVPRRIKQKENINVAKDRNKLLEKSKSEWNVKDNSSQNKSWAMALLKPSVSSVPKAAVAAPANQKVGVNKKLEKKLNLSLKKVNPCKIKQSILPFNSSKDSSAIESDVCEDIIDASPVVSKSSRAGKSLLHRSGHNHTSYNSSSPTTTNSSSNNIELKIDDNNQKPDETVSSMPIENIVFDFSPTKKQDANSLNSPVSKSLLSPKQLHFNADVGNDTTTDCVALPSDQSILSKSGDSSSVVLLTPATQDIIFLDDTNNDLSDINTMDLLADIQKHETEYLENLKRYESKNIEKKQKQPVQPPLTKKEDKAIFIKPVASIKREKHSQNFSAEKRHKIENDNELPSTSSKRQKFQNPLLASEPGEEGEGEEEDEDDVMPQPFIIKEEPKDLQGPSRKLTLKERLNIDCQECEKLYRILGPSITDRDLEMHLRRCTYHNRNDIMRQNTPDNFWNPFILSFDENDPRNEVLIDTRFKDRNMK